MTPSADVAGLALTRPRALSLFARLVRLAPPDPRSVASCAAADRSARPSRSKQVPRLRALVLLPSRQLAQQVTQPTHDTHHHHTAACMNTHCGAYAHAPSSRSASCPVLTMAPLKSLREASPWQVFEEFEKYAGALGLRVGLATGQRDFSQVRAFK